MSELTTDRVRKAWGDVNAWSITCGTKPSDFFPEFDAWHRKELAKAWAEGFDAGERDAFDADREGHVCTPNPYKEA